MVIGLQKIWSVLAHLTRQYKLQHLPSFQHHSTKYCIIFSSLTVDLKEVIHGMRERRNSVVCMVGYQAADQASSLFVSTLCSFSHCSNNSTVHRAPEEQKKAHPRSWRNSCGRNAAAGDGAVWTCCFFAVTIECLCSRSSLWCIEYVCNLKRESRQNDMVSRLSWIWQPVGVFCCANIVKWNFLLLCKQHASLS